jgi:UDP-N-acetylmuramate: L-alanyl-gamma-D-glutamyl-meso-diaminopimelate ligase
VRKIAYSIPENIIRDGSTFITLDGIEGGLKVFGDHNLLNLNAAYLACKELGLTAKDFLVPIAGFTGASKRLELIAKNEKLSIYRDFAHAPSKVNATMHAVRQQFPKRKLIAVLELHTYSSLNAGFMSEYQHAMDEADGPAVFYSKHALELKRMPELPKEAVEKGFGTPGLKVFNDRKHLEAWLLEQNYDDACLLLMSSGNYDGLDIATFANKLM